MGQVPEGPRCCLDYTQPSKKAASAGQTWNRNSQRRKESKVRSARWPGRTGCYTNIRMHRAEKRRFGVRLPGECSVLLLAVATATVAAQTSKAPEISPDELVRSVVANEVAAANNATIKHMFRSRKQTPRGSQTRLYVETNDAMAGTLVAINDEPLTSQQQQGETNHLVWLMSNPDQLRKKHAHEKEDAERTLRIVKALPDAFRYEYASDGDLEAGPGAHTARLNFVPNPSYSPPSHLEQVLTGMHGYLLIDLDRRRIALIDGTLFKDVTFGWGIIGRLDKGGHFRVRQGNLGDGTWDITEMNLNITGKILLLKGLSMVSDEVFSDFRRVPDNLTFAQGVELLKAERERMGHSHPPEPSASESRR